MLDKTQVQQQLSAFGEKLTGDAFLFALVDLRLPSNEQIPRIMVGSQAAGLIKDGHYHVEFVGENSTSSVNLRDKQIAEVLKNNPAVVVPKSVAEQLADAKAKIAELEAAQAKAKAPAPASDAPKKDK